MASRYMDYPSPRGVHVPETYYSNDPDDPYRRPSSRRNRYSRSVHQTPRFKDVTWISSPDPLSPQTPYAPPSPWAPPVSQAPPSPAHRPPSVFPSPAPTVGERMDLDELAKVILERPKEALGLPPSSVFSHPQTELLREPDNRDAGATTERAERVRGPNTARVGDGDRTEEQRGPTRYTSPYVRPAKIGATPSVIPGSLRASPVLVYSPVPVRSLDTAPPIRVVSPSIPPSPRPNSVRSILSARLATPGPVPRALSVNASDPGGSTEEGSQTLHEPVFPNPALPPGGAIPVVRSDEDKSPIAPVGSGGGGILFQPPLVDPSFPNGSLASTVARIRGFVANLDSLPWVSGEQIADEYVPEKNWRSQMRKKVRQGAEPSWYNPRPEVAERPAYWSEWDMWAKQSTAALWDGTVGVGRGEVGPAGWAGVGAHGTLGPGPDPAPWGAVYPHGVNYPKHVHECQLFPRSEPQQTASLTVPTTPRSSRKRRHDKRFVSPVVPGPLTRRSLLFYARAVIRYIVLWVRLCRSRRFWNDRSSSLALSTLAYDLDSKRHTKTHTLCRRCGNRAFHRQHKTCAQCGYPSAKLRSYEWGLKAKRRKTTGTGRMRYLKYVSRRFKNGFRENTVAKKRVRKPTEV
ncbi:hypothetical protein JVT61DRAFT_3995 [Boletus reticuloceps]|uniref:60S ribosomal protein L37 n=1 Tax=Boletus reticuloceps TaxID=495285 RepID=A0A8I3A993_9AGAM|nr:hypothetical protein JVT61DRAFT_3995 [Boletus reticuloceps]